MKGTSKFQYGKSIGAPGNSAFSGAPVTRRQDAALQTFASVVAGFAMLVAIVTGGIHVLLSVLQDSGAISWTLSLGQSVLVAVVYVSWRIVASVVFAPRR